MLEFLAGEGGIALLDVNPGLLIWTTVTFLVVMIVLRMVAWKPIIKALDERAEKIHADLDRAEAVKDDAEAKLDEYMKKLNGLKQEGHDIVTEAKKDAEDLKKEILDEARTEAEAIKNRGLRDIQLAMDKALESYHKEITDLSVTIAGQIVGKSLSAADHKKLIGDSIDSIKKVS